MLRVAFSILQLALVAGIVLVGLSIYRKQATIDEAATSTPPPAVEQASARQTSDQPGPFANYQIIARRDLFRTPRDARPDPTAIDVDALKPTDLKLKLWGTITGEDGMTRAVIEDQTKRKQAFYRAGEEVSSAKVKMILREKVILSVQGEDQILEIQKPSSVASGTTARPAAVRSPRASRPRQVAPSREPGTRAPRAVRLKLSRLGTISEDPEDWSTYAAAAPFKGDDGSSGLILNRITPSSPLRRLGIRNGDVVMNINEEPISSLEDIIIPLTELSAGDAMQLNFKRRGRERRYDFKFE